MTQLAAHSPLLTASLSAADLMAQERARSVRWLSTLRGVAAWSFFGVYAVLGGLLHRPAWQGNLSVALSYASIASFLWWGAKSGRRWAGRISALSLVVLDMPAVCAAQLLTYPTTPNPGAVAGYTMGLYVFLMLLVSLTVERHWVLVAAVVASVLEAILQVNAGISRGATVSTFGVLGLTALTLSFTTSRVRSLLESRAKEALAREQALEALRVSERSFASLLEASPDPVLVYREQRVAHANPAMLRFLRCATLEALQDRSVQTLIHSDQQGWLEHQASDPGGEVRLVRLDGTPVVASLTRLEVVWQGQLATLCLARDLTAAKEAQARALAADRMVSLGTIAAGVVHELNNPLAYVDASIQYVSGALPDAQARRASAEDWKELTEAASQAKEGVKRMRSIVADVKAFSHGGTSSDELFDVRGVVSSAINMASGHLKNQAKLIRALDSVPEVEGNPGRLGQVILNLIVNAAQALQERSDGRESSVTVATLLGQDGRILIEVRDTGPGIPVEIRSRMFEPFFTTKPAGVGTGLGLSICRTLITEMGGEIGFRTELGKGTTFFVSLPAAV